MGAISRRAFLKGASSVVATAMTGTSKVFSSFGSQKSDNLRDLANSIDINPTLNIDPEGVEQVWLTEVARDTDVRGFFYAHDHVFFKKLIGRTVLDKEMIGACVGATTFSGDLLYEKIWSNPYWMEFYGPWYEDPPPFLTPPGITELEKDKDGTTIRYVCTAPPECMYANMSPGTKPGDILREYRITR